MKEIQIRQSQLYFLESVLIERLGTRRWQRKLSGGAGALKLVKRSLSSEQHRRNGAIMM